MSQPAPVLSGQGVPSANQHPESPGDMYAPRRGTERAIVVCDQWLGSDGYAGMRALRRAGWNVLVAPEWEFVPVRWRSPSLKIAGRLVRPFATREYNRELLLLARRFAPEVLLVFKGRFVQAETLKSMREMGVRTYCFYPDISFRAHGPDIPKALPEYDWVFTTKSFGIQDMRDQLGVTRSSVIAFAYDPDLHKPLRLTPADRARFECDVSYIGTWSPKKEQLLSKLVASRPTLRLKIWGEQWHRASVPSLRAAIGGHEVIGEDFVRAVRGSRINLSIMSEARRGASLGDQVASRTFVVPACDAFVLHERTDEVLRLFREPDEIVCYADSDELIGQIDRYLPDEAARTRIAARARDLVRRRHSWDARIAEILERHRLLGSDTRS
jgi:spore maturation protein CgeB